MQMVQGCGVLAMVKSWDEGISVQVTALQDGGLIRPPNSTVIYVVSLSTTGFKDIPLLLT